MNELNTILIIAAIIQLVTLIVFFVMAYNVSEIKRRMEKKPSTAEYIKMSNEEKYIGNKAKAKEYLLRADYIMSQRFKVSRENKENWGETFVEDQLEEITYERDKIKSLLKELK